MRTKTLLALTLAALSYTSIAHASKKHILPDSCGDTKAEFEIDKGDETLNSSPIASGNFRIYFIETYDKHFGMPTIQTRFAADGKWLGATKNNTYFFVDLPAGEHKFCFSVKDRDQFVGMQTVNGEAGKTYYLESKFDLILGPVRSTAGANGTTNISRSSTFDNSGTLLDADAGKFRIKASDPVKSTLKKKSDD